MKILYGLQGTGNGHLSRALEMVPNLLEIAEVDVLISGSQYDLKTSFEIKYDYNGLGFKFGKKGGVDVWSTIKSSKPIQFIVDAINLPLENYDLIISDFEPITAWASKIKGAPSIALSHQAAFLSPRCPRPTPRQHWAEWVMRSYAPCKDWIGFHFEAYESSILEPIIRSNIQNLTIEDNDFITVYLPAYQTQYLLDIGLSFPEEKWRFYVKGLSEKKSIKNVELIPVGNESWLESIATCKGVIMGAGFEGPSEMLFLGKPLLAIPMKNQYEQLCNAKALEQIGIDTMSGFSPKQRSKIQDWLEHLPSIRKDYKPVSQQVVTTILEKCEALHSSKNIVTTSTI